MGFFGGGGGGGTVGPGTTNTVAKFTDSTTIDDSGITDTGTLIKVNSGATGDTYLGDADGAGEGASMFLYNSFGAGAAYVQILAGIVNAPQIELDNSNNKVIISTPGSHTRLNGMMVLEPRVFANLVNPEEGMMAWITDGSTATWGATVAGGGANKILVVYNGTNWTVAGK